MKKTSPYVRVPLTAALALGIGISLAGCSSEPADESNAPEVSQPAPDTNTDSEQSAPADNPGSGDIVDEDGDIPAWLLDGFPLYPGSVVAGAGGTGDLTIISFSVPNADAQQIYDWFVEKYSADGWEASNLDDGSMSFDAANADGRTASINVTKSTFVISASQG